MPDLVITTSRKTSPELTSRAGQWSGLLGAPLVPRRERAIDALCRDEGASGVLVVAAERPTYHEPSREIEYFFHPNLASIRIRNLDAGQVDHMVAAMGLGPGDEVLDCTMGRASEAIICAHVVGEAGRVVAIEKVPVIAHLTIEGLRTTEFVGKTFIATMRRVDARCADYNEFLRECERDEFDVVYFDPIFDRPIYRSESMEGLRAMAHAEPVRPEVVAEAVSVARRCVVIKQPRDSRLWEELGVVSVRGGKGSRVEYGVIDAR